MAASSVTIQALDLVRRALSAQTAHNVDVDEITVAEEGSEVSIVLIPHRDLGGYALIVSAFKNRFLWLSWGGVMDLRYHDDIDMARRAFDFDGPGWPDNDTVRAAVEAEFKRPIHVTLGRSRLRRRWQLWCAVELSGKLARAFVRDVAPPSTPGDKGTVELGTTSLVGPERPSVQWPVPLAEWRRWADPAWPAGT